MKIKDIFEKDCGRRIPVNVSLNYSEEDDIYKLINEFSLTSNVLNNILEFILFYNYQLENHEFTHALILGERGTGKHIF